MTCAGLIALGAANACDRLPAGTLTIPDPDANAAIPPQRTTVSAAFQFIEAELLKSHGALHQLIANNGRLVIAPTPGRPGTGQVVVHSSVDYATGRAKTTTMRDSGVPASPGRTEIVPRDEWGSRLNYYELWSAERVAVAFNLDRIGKFDWYSSGASLLLALQTKDGSWVDRQYGAVAGTAFALLFLGKVNLAPQISTKLATSPGLSSQILAQEKTYACMWTRKSAGRGPPWQLSFTVSTPTDYLQIVEKLRASLIIIEGRNAWKIDKPASAADSRRRENPKLIIERADLWHQEAGELLTAVAESLGRRQIDALFIELPASTNRQVLTAFAKQVSRNSQRRLLSLDPNGGRLKSESLDPDKLSLQDIGN
jgi:hypothetical protein